MFILDQIKIFHFEKETVANFIRTLPFCKQNLAWLILPLLCYGTHICKWEYVTQMNKVSFMVTVGYFEGLQYRGKGSVICVLLLSYGCLRSALIGQVWSTITLSVTSGGGQTHWAYQPINQSSKTPLPGLLSNA